VSLVGETGAALEKIVSQVQQVNSNAGAIVESSKEQAMGLKEINTAVNAMDQGTQQNAAMVEESTAAAHSLAQQAQSLFQLLRQFKVGEVPQQTGLRSVTPSYSGANALYSPPSDGSALARTRLAAVGGMVIVQPVGKISDEEMRALQLGQTLEKLNFVCRKPS
jgi:methyl-accepting chemotaxis protein